MAVFFKLSVLFISTLILFSLTSAVEECSNEAKNQNKLVDDISWNQLEQDDPLLVEAVKKIIIPPVSPNVPYKFSQSKLDVRGQFGEAEVLAKLIGDKKDGFFIEAGAYDGELISNTLHFEANQGWQGLLVEPNPDVFATLKTKNRKSNLFGRCLSTKTRPEIVQFDAAGVFGGIINGDKKPGDIGMQVDGYRYKRRTVEIQCFPLYTLLLALGNPVVDLLSLDIEGAELQVLQTIPWDKVDIRFLVIEVEWAGRIFDSKVSDIHQLLTDNGYVHFDTININQIFVRKDFQRPDVVRSFKSFLEVEP